MFDDDEVDEEIINQQEQPQNTDVDQENLFGSEVTIFAKPKKEEKPVKVRHVNGLQIVFYDTETTYIIHKTGINIYHTWFLKKDGIYYEHIRYFRRALMELREPTITHINHLAYRHGLVVQACEKIPDFKGREVKIIDSEPEEGK